MLKLAVTCWLHICIGLYGLLFRYTHARYLLNLAIYFLDGLIYLLKKQAKMSPIDFDYLGYFFLRYDEYKKQKDTCLSLGKSYLSGSKTH